MRRPPPDFQTPGFGLPTGPPRPGWSGEGVRDAAAPGGQHDCFSAQEILRLTTRSSLFHETELHLLGGLASGCATCLSAIGKARSCLKFQEATGPEIELLRTLTLYPPKALPIALRQAVEDARSGGVANILTLLVESAALLCWENPRRFLAELEYIRALIGPGEVAGGAALNARIDMFCARAWLRVEDVAEEEKHRRATVALEAALIQARASVACEVKVESMAKGAADLLATILAARSELEPAHTARYLREAISHLQPGNPLRSELLCELAASLGEQPETALEVLLQAAAESESLDEQFPELCLNIFHYTAATAAKRAHLEGNQPPDACLYLALAVAAHALSQTLLDTYPLAKRSFKTAILHLDLSLMVALEGTRSCDDLEEQWARLSVEDHGAGMKALELLWLAKSQGFHAFVDSHLATAQRRWRFSCSDMMERALALQNVASGSTLDRQVLTPFLALLGHLETTH